MDFSSLNLKKEPLYIRENHTEWATKKDLSIKYCFNKWAPK